MYLNSDKSLEMSWEEASLSNNFIFFRVMSENLDICKEFLEMLLNIQIESIRLAQPETTLDVDFFAKGIRLDVYVKDETDRMFDILDALGTRVPRLIISLRQTPLWRKQVQHDMNLSFRTCFGIPLIGLYNR